MHLSVHYLPQFVDESDLAGHVVLVVDLLRASTTICQALASGACGVVPCLEVDETMSKAQAYHRDAIILGGERGGDLIPGFDLGNSPADYTANEVFGRTVLFTTTNGTRAIVYAHLASRVLIGAAVNRQAVADAAATEDAVDIVCAGTGGSVTREDILAAGAIVDSMIASAGPGAYKTNRWALSAAREWQELQTAARALGRTESAQLAQELRNTQGGKNLVALGFDHDLEACAQLDTLDVVPELDRKTGQVR